MTEPPAIELVFSGPGVKAENLNARQALELAAAYVETLTAIAECDFGDVPPFDVALRELKRGSVRYVFAAIADKSDAVAHELFDSAARKVDSAIRAPQTADEPVRPKAKRLHEAASKIPAHIEVCSRRRGKGAWKHSITEAVRGPTPARLRSFDTLRVTILRCGGITPRVVVNSETEGVLYLRATRDQASRAGMQLYREADVDVEFTREDRPGRPIVLARLLDMRFVEVDADPVAAWDNWYEAAGRPGEGLVDDLEGDRDGKKKVGVG